MNTPHRIIETETNHTNRLYPMTVLDDIPELKSEGTISIICRHIYNEFWKACIERVKTNDISVCVAAIGSPGIARQPTRPSSFACYWSKEKRLSTISERRTKLACSISSFQRLMEQQDWYKSHSTPKPCR
jgi:hypothetical protein